MLTPRKVVTGIYQMWLPSQSVLNQGTAFLNPVSSDTLTIPSTASRVVTVGAYDARSFSYADFSGRGALEKNAEMWVQKPDLAAPGVRVTTAKAGGGYGEYSGTSFAVPFVTGSAALLMEWGIIRGNDPYLYGEKVKAYLRRGARHLPGYEQWPNNQLGYGVLCVEESLPFLKMTLTCVRENAIMCVIRNALEKNMRENTYIKIETLYRKYRGYVETKNLLAEGFSNRQISTLVNEGYLQKVCYGHYWLSGKQCKKPFDYKCIEVSLSNPDAVICMNSALYYQGVLSAEPDYLSVATERTDRSMMKMDFMIQRHYFSNRNFNIGIRKQETEFGTYNIYDIERSVCDLYRLEGETEIEVGIVKNIKENKYLYNRLLKYAEVLQIKRGL